MSDVGLWIYGKRLLPLTDLVSWRRLCLSCLQNFRLQPAHHHSWGLSKSSKRRKPLSTEIPQAFWANCPLMSASSFRGQGTWMVSSAGPSPSIVPAVVTMALWGQDYEKALSMVDSFIVFWPSALWKDFFSFLFFFLRVWEHAVLKCNLKTSHHYIAARKGYSGEKENTPVWSSW